MAATETEIAAQLIERLLADPAFRDRFRRDPATACREAGLESLAEEMRLGAGKAMHTLDIRESRSSLAGVMMAAAMEGMGIYEFSKHVVPHIEDLSGSLGDVLSRVNLPALPGAGALAGEPEPSRAPLVAPGEPEVEPVVARGAGAAAPVAPAEAGGTRDGAAPVAPGAAVGKRDDEAPVAPELAGVRPDGAAAREAADGGKDGGRKPASPELAGLQDAPAGAGRSKDDDGSGGLELPDAGVEPARSEGGPERGGEAPAPVPAAPAAAAAPVAEAAPARSGPVDPSMLGQDGSGGSANAEARAILNNPNVVFDDVGVADLKAGKIDPRIVGVLTKLSQDHKIVVSCMCSDHSKFTAGGSISNHAFGRGLDIASIDGEIVSPGSALAREVSSALSELDPAIRPDEIGSPFAINGPGYFTDAAHMNHIHVGFKQQITPDFKLPAELQAGGPAPPPTAPAAPDVAAPAAVPAAPEAAAPPPDPRKQSGLFAAAPQPANVAAAEVKDAASRSESNLFLQAVKPAEQPARTAAAPEPAAAAPVDLANAPTDYPGDDAPKEQIAAWMAAEAKKRGLPPQLPVMAALVESNLSNVDYGDADSLGYFQMRVSIWNQGEYAGYPDDPKKQIDWFLDTAERVKTQRIERGQPIDDPNHYGEWIADIERPAEQYRGRYQLRLDEANTLLESAPPKAAAPAPADAAEAAAPPAMAQGAGPRALAALKEAQKYTGTPYKWGGSTPQTGFDCSGLVQWAYAQAGVKIPRVTHEQILATNGKAVPRAELLPGDLVFFRDPSGYVYHVGISMGGDKFLHAPRTGDVVKVASLDEPYYNARFTGGRRFDDAAATAAPAVPAAPPAVAPAVDPVAVASAQAAVARDAAEASRQNSSLFKAINAQEARNHQAAMLAKGDRAVASAAPAEGGERRESALFLDAITAEQAAKAKAAAEAAAPAPAPAAPEPPPPAPAAPELTPPGPPPDLSDVPADYPGDDAGQKALAKWLAKEAEKAGLPPELPVMAALVESGVRNLDFGDADSVGFFQMRTSIWNQGEYAGYPENPGLQAKWFIDHALAHKKQQIARGDADFGKDPSAWGEWIADVERPAEQYRGRYQLRLEEARRLLR